MPERDTYAGEFDRGEGVVVALVLAGGAGAEGIEPVEEALDEVAVAIKEGAERGSSLAIRGIGLMLARLPARSFRS